MPGSRERQAAEAALDNLGQPGLRERAEQAAAGDRALALLTRQQQRDTLTVLRLLAAEGAYSEKSAAYPHLADTVERLVRWGFVETEGYPWTAVRLTDRGRHLLAGMWAPPPKER